jgi:hypothetical protein
VIRLVSIFQSKNYKSSIKRWFWPNGRHKVGRQDSSIYLISSNFLSTQKLMINKEFLEKSSKYETFLIIYINTKNIKNFLENSLWHSLHTFYLFTIKYKTRIIKITQKEMILFLLSMNKVNIKYWFRNFQKKNLSIFWTN